VAAPLAIVLVTIVRFTLPSFDADTSVAGDGCAAGTHACTDLDSVFVWVQERGKSSASLVYRARVRGQEGQQLQVPIALDSVATVWAVTQDTLGHRSCPSNRVGVNLVAGVTPAAAPTVIEWFDVAGRKLHEKPTAPGVYFWRRGRERGVRVVLR